jgi:hypothetical protein
MVRDKYCASLKETCLHSKIFRSFVSPTKRGFTVQGFLILQKQADFFNQRRWDYCLCVLKSFKSFLSISKQLDASYGSDVARMLLVEHDSHYSYNQFTHNAALRMKVGVEFCVLAASLIIETGYMSRKSCFNV